MAEHQRELVAEQLARKDRLARELRAEKGRLEAMKKELQSLTRPFDSSMPPQVCPVSGAFARLTCHYNAKRK